MRNIEMKARLAHYAHAEHICGTLAGARYSGDIQQVDTYYRVPEGRLKLREKSPGDAELIFYRRPDAMEARACDYEVVRAPGGLKSTLADALGVLAVVRKVRRLWLWHNVRIHLDRVEGLGDFVEFEAVLDDEHADADGHARLATLWFVFGLSQRDVVPVSYLDLMLEKKEGGLQVTSPP